ncbi:PQQ-binding-like beta-propeller repeat protein [Natrinema sp. 1APR25-10V2]|uniref:PQQ-binding-like beta-propeller repeat protein n=1 Tax=Natrinema sp. 1APR25-10V2 TaxID=2951081 RepID=UPI002875EB7F|nr:PQQ-binding-like beta-propeller repeat protein [Natrinema sp. 1APR25-10V2]MDS0474516.1 PQQ-binding-like beta-propeller repeat protein [Natrinema sp. 1APR25-10V2]
MLDDSRRGFLKTVSVAAGATSVGGIAIAQEATGADQWEQPHGWTAFREGPQRTGAIAEAGPAPYATTDWTLPLDGTMRTGSQGHVAEPVLADGTLYLAVATETGTYDSTGYVVAYDSTTGDQLWKRTDLPAPRTPAVGDEMLYVATNPPTISQDGHGGFVALDADTGETGWYRDDHLDWADPLLAAGNLYTSRLARSADDQSVCQLDPSTGETIWKTDTVGGQISYATGTLFVSTGSALDANDGSVQWNVSAETGGGATVQTVRDGRVFGIERREGENEYVIQSRSTVDGTLRWMYPFVGDEDDEYISRLAVDDERVYFVTHVGDPTNAGGRSTTITALAAETGTLQWRYETDAYLAGDPTVADGTLYVGGKYGPASSPDPEVPAYYNGLVFAIDAASGEYEWGYVLDSENTAGTPVVVDETVYTATYDPTELEAEYIDATLYALESSTDRPDAAHRPGNDAC